MSYITLKQINPHPIGSVWMLFKCRGDKIFISPINHPSDAIP